MQSLSESQLLEVAERIRQLAAGVTDPADVAAIESYARKVEQDARRADAPDLPRAE